MATSVIMMELLGRGVHANPRRGCNVLETPQCWPASAGVLARGRSIRLSRTCRHGQRSDDR